MQEIEGDEVQIMLAPRDGLAQRCEVGNPRFVGDDDLAVDDGVLDVQFFSCINQVSIFCRPIQTTTSEDANVRVIDDDL